MEKKRLNNIINIRYVQKVNKYIVDLAISNENKQTVWLTEKQMINLNKCFSETKKGYSDRDISVYGHWNNKGYYAFTSLLHHKQAKQFKAPVQPDVSDLWEDD